MSQTKLKQTITALLTAVLLLASIAPVASAANATAPAAQLRAEEVTGTLPGGQFAKIWLGLAPKIQGEDITLTSDWDRNNPENNGVGFFVLDENGLTEVLNGGADVREANLSAGSRLSSEAPANQLGAQFRATGGSYTVVLFNDSGSDANFTLSATNAFITDNSDQVSDPNAPRESATSAEGETDDTATDDTATDDTATDDTATDDTETDDTVDDSADDAAADDTAATDDATADATETPTATTTSTTTETVETVATSAPISTGPLEAQELRGELPEQNDQHFFGLEPSVANGNVQLLLSFDPQDSSELARRLNFWVLNQDGFRQFLDPNDDVILSNIAIAAGSSDPQIAANQRRASFTSSGFGPYVVIVYNNSLVPAIYSLSVDGGTLIDDSGQSLTSQQSSVSASGTVTTTADAGDADSDDATADDAATNTTTDATTTDATTTATTRVGEPGSSYTIQSGDTISLIARDIYGDIGLWDEICAYNELADCNVVEVGQVLQLPTTEEIGAGIAAAATPAATPTATSTPTVQQPAAISTATASSAVTSTDTLTDTEDVDTADDDAAETDEEMSDEESSDSESMDAGETTTDTTSADTPSAVNVVAALEAQGSFNTLIEALDAAGLTEALEGAGPFTVFAPTDEAFNALPPGALDQLLGNPTGQLTQILLFHVLPGSVTTSDIDNGMQATTQQGKAVNFEVTADGTVRVNGANVVTSDILASNGVVHPIDAVILPPPD